jgi:hypothetical protein
MRRLALILAKLGVSLACTTPYQPKGFAGGYTDTRLTEEIYLVEFRGNGYTPRQQVEIYLLYRCAELTREAGYTHFVILDDDSEVQRSAVLAPGQWKGNSSAGTYYPGQVVPVTRYGANARIKMLREEPEEEFAFEAEELLRNLGPKVKR